MVKVDWPARRTAGWPYEFPGAYWLDEQEDQAVLDVLQNGSLFRYYGLDKPKYVDSFEAAAREFYGSKYALAVNSGTGALMPEQFCQLAMDMWKGEEECHPGNILLC